MNTVISLVPLSLIATIIVDLFYDRIDVRLKNNKEMDLEEISEFRFSVLIFSLFMLFFPLLKFFITGNLFN